MLTSPVTLRTMTMMMFPKGGSLKGGCRHTSQQMVAWIWRVKLLVALRGNLGILQINDEHYGLMCLIGMI